MRYVAQALGGAVIFVALIVMFGWIFDVDLLRRIVPGLVTMKFSTALSFLLAGVVLLATALRERTVADWVDVLLPSAVLLISILMGTQLISVLFGFQSGIENLFVEDRVNAVLTTVPGRPSVGTMVAFLFVAGLGLTGLSRWNLRFRLYLIFGLFVALLGAAALAGYLVSQPVLYFAIGDFSSAMAVHTAILFVLLGGGYAALALNRRRV